MNLSTSTWALHPAFTNVICKVLNHLFCSDCKDITLFWWGEIVHHKRVTKERTLTCLQNQILLPLGSDHNQDHTVLLFSCLLRYNRWAHLPGITTQKRWAAMIDQTKRDLKSIAKARCKWQRDGWKNCTPCLWWELNCSSQVLLAFESLVFQMLKPWVQKDYPGKSWKQKCASLLQEMHISQLHLPTPTDYSCSLLLQNLMHHHSWYVLKWWKKVPCNIMLLLEFLKPPIRIVEVLYSCPFSKMTIFKFESCWMKSLL